MDEFFGKSICEDSRYPEDWIASDTEAFNPDAPIVGEGLSRCQDGRHFRDILRADPVGVLGERCANEDQGKLSILVKLLDAAERLVIQCHPTVPFAKEHFNSSFGKTECWYMLKTEEDACVYLGFREGITREKWVSLFEKQDIEGMLSCLHCFPVQDGELWFVEGGVPHAIGGGCLMIELQEPSDLMVIPERKTPSGILLNERKLHGGLGFDRMFDCFVYEGLSAEETRARYCRDVSPIANRSVSVVDEAMTDKFSLKLVRADGEYSIDLGDHYAIGIVTEGGCTLKAADEAVMLTKGENFFISANSGELSFLGDCTAVLCISH